VPLPPLDSPPSTDPKPFSGHLVVFTGKLMSFSRRDAQKLVERLGGATSDDLGAATTLLVIGGGGAGGAGGAGGLVGGGASAPSDGEKSHKVRRAEEIKAKYPGQLAIVSEEEFCRLAGLPSPNDLRRQYHAARDIVARYRALREDHVRYLVKYGIVRPVVRMNADTLFSFADLTIIKQVAEDLGRGQPFPAILRTLLASQRGQLSFDFRAEGAAAKVLALVPRPARSPAGMRASADAVSQAEEYFRQASVLDEGDEGESARAAAAYRQALELDPHLVPALINLANLHYAHDELPEAQALYERAIDEGAEYFEAHFNLGNVHHDMGRFAQAKACYERALSLNPHYPDAHFYLAVTLEKMGLSAEARPHWVSYQRLAPTGEWIQLAQEFSE
jgi:tetratricopeptide (TPR) repeat protein